MGDDDGNLATAEQDSAPAAKEVRTTRVEVVKGLGAKDSFDPGALYRELSPGVVTILSLFDGGAPATPGGDDRGEGGQGSGFLIDSEGHIATNAHVVTDGTGGSAKRAKQVYIEFSDGNRVQAKIVGTDLNADVALLKIDPAGLRITPLALGALRGACGSASPSRRSAARSASASRSRSAWCRPSTATSSRSPPSGSAARSRPTPPSTPATRAGRCSTPRAA